MFFIVDCATVVSSTKKTTSASISKISACSAKLEMALPGKDCSTTKQEVIYGHLLHTLAPFVYSLYYFISHFAHMFVFEVCGGVGRISRMKINGSQMKKDLTTQVIRAVYDFLKA